MKKLIITTKTAWVIIKIQDYMKDYDFIVSLLKER